jgi:hypothetical protein
MAVLMTRIVFCLLWVTGCAPGILRGGPDEEGRSGPRDPFEPGPASDGGSYRGPDAGPPESPPRTLSGIYGTIRFENRDISPSGLASATPVLATAIAVELVSSSGSSLGRTTTDASGTFEFPLDPSGTQIRISAAYDGPAGRLVVTDQSGALYAWERSVVAETPNAIAITEGESSGAIAILMTEVEGLEFASAALATSQKPDVNVFWERGRNTPGGTSYEQTGASAGQTELWILGTAEDSDEFDVPVLLHELGHAMQDTYGWTDTVEGDAHAGNDTDPRNAWSEGSATLFGQLVLNSSVYMDSFESGGSASSWDIDNPDPSSRAQPSRGLTQTLHEDLVSMTGWKLYRERAESTAQRDRAFQVLRDWVGAGRDRGAGGADLVDYLDGYICTHGDASRNTIQTHLVDGRGFPYDFGMRCKPGRPRTTVPIARICAEGPSDVACSWSLANGTGALSYRESIVLDSNGRRLHLIDLDVPVQVRSGAGPLAP